MGKKSLSIKSQQRRMGILFTAAPIILFLAFTFIPMILAIGLSFTNYDIINQPKFTGIRNFQRLINDEFFWLAFRNTAFYSLLYIPLGLLISLGTALFLNVEKKAVGIFRTLFYLPVLSSTVATATLWFWILNPQLGLLNGFLRLFGVQGPAWLYDSKFAMLSIVLMSLWAGFGANMMIFLSGLKGIPSVFYEAAKVEGANAWYTFRKVTIPSLSRTIFLVSTLLIINSFQVFDQAYVLTKGGPGNATLTLVYYIYNNGFANLRMGYASSISLALFLMILGITIINQRLSNEKI